MRLQTCRIWQLDILQRLGCGSRGDSELPEVGGVALGGHHLPQASRSLVHGQEILFVSLLTELNL